METNSVELKAIKEFLSDAKLFSYLKRVNVVQWRYSFMYS
jgi:hypothetical protein